MGWVRRRFKGNKIWVKADESGNLIVTKGRVEIKYREEDTRTYQAALRRVERLELEPLVVPPRPPAPHPDDPPGTIVIYSDGSCFGNPGPAGWGAYLRYGAHSRDLSGYLGEATSNIAELQAIREALAAIRNRSLPVLLYSDSRYARGVLARGWKANVNRELIEATRELIASFRELSFRWVKGHRGVPENEWVDYLARKAIRDGRGY
ncbi:MAG: ribonuclease H [Planctomycetota bacterium]